MRRKVLLGDIKDTHQRLPVKLGVHSLHLSVLTQQLGLSPHPLCQLLMEKGGGKQRWRYSSQRGLLLLGQPQDLEITMLYFRGAKRAGKLRARSAARSFPLHAVRAQAEGGEGLFVGFSLPSSTGTVIFSILENTAEVGGSTQEQNSLKIVALEDRDILST